MKDNQLENFLKQEETDLDRLSDLGKQEEAEVDKIPIPYASKDLNEEDMTRCDREMDEYMEKRQYNSLWEKMIREIDYAFPSIFPVSRASYELNPEDRELIGFVLGQEIDDKEWKNLCELELDLNDAE